MITYFASFSRWITLCCRDLKLVKDERALLGNCWVLFEYLLDFVIVVLIAVVLPDLVLLDFVVVFVGFAR